MPLQDFAFTTGGSWDTTFVLYNGQNWDAARRFTVELRTFDENEGDGGIDEGGRLFGEVEFVDPSIDQTQYSDPLSMPTVVGAIFPGKISFSCLGKPTIEIENIDPDFEFLQTIVRMDGIDITDRIKSAKFVIDAINDVVEGWIKYVDEVHFGIPNVTLLYIL